MNTNSNTYTIIYASVMVIIVAFLLAFVSGALKETQDENVRLDKKKQILTSLNVNYEGEDAAALYDKYVKEELIINYAGDVVEETGAFDLDVKAENDKVLEERNLAVFVCEVDGESKYVLPIRGAGLWGPIWGYIALDADKNTVYGTYFSHQGETPGLGAEIAKPKFSNAFKSKKIKNAAGEFVSIAIVKPGKTDDTKDYVDGISGGTITSQGVDAMLMDGLGQYVNFLNK
ncbi:MAG: NADH:ubiquinone reductase (Na(+)-transporting) subunit C [Paludibacteraceae bacterium]|nr:NADH:ubiquinone reductase (Na(+)-transporting) subunit C [Paludibacteraceae bacterium]